MRGSDGGYHWVFCVLQMSTYSSTFVKNVFFLSFWCLCDQPPVKILGAESLMGFPGQKHHTTVTAGGALCSVYPSWEGESMRKRARGFLQTLSVSFPCDPAA